MEMKARFALLGCAVMLVLNGCGKSDGTEPAAGASSSPAVSAAATGSSAIEPEETTFYLSSSEGWKVERTAIGMHREEKKFYKTIDAGETFQLIADSEREGDKTPGGVMAGMAFLDSDRGWVIANAPWQGKVGIFQTKDGGASWEEQSADVPKAFSEDEIHADSLTFLDKRTGLILAHLPTATDRSLFYLTTNAGETWLPIADQLTGSEDGVAWTFELNANGTLQGEVRYRQDSLQTAGGGWSRDFLTGMFVTDDDYANDAKNKMLVDMVIANLKAIVAKDWQAFSENMESPQLTESLRMQFDNAYAFRFIGIDSIYQLGDDPNRMNIAVSAEVKTDEGAFLERSVTYTLRPDKKNVWHIAEID